MFITLINNNKYFITTYHVSSNSNSIRPNGHCLSMDNVPTNHQSNQTNNNLNMKNHNNEI